MRFMITCRIPMEKANELAMVGSLCSTIQSRVDELRGGYIVVNIDDASQISAIVEPPFFWLGATIQIHPVMSPEDLGQATRVIEQASQKKYG
jgi:hypothetical protein